MSCIYQIPIYIYSDNIDKVIIYTEDFISFSTNTRNLEFKRLKFFACKS